MGINHKGFWIGTLIGAIGSYAIIQKVKTQDFPSNYVHNARKFAENMISKAKSYKEPKPLISKHQWVYGVCGLLATGAGVILSMQKQAKFKKIIAERQTIRSSKHNGKGHHTLQPNKKHTQTRKHS